MIPAEILFIDWQIGTLPGVFWPTWCYPAFGYSTNYTSVSSTLTGFLSSFYSGPNVSLFLVPFFLGCIINRLVPNTFKLAISTSTLHFKQEKKKKKRLVFPPLCSVFFTSFFKFYPCCYYLLSNISLVDLFSKQFLVK